MCFFSCTELLFIVVAAVAAFPAFVTFFVFIFNFFCGHLALLKLYIHTSMYMFVCVCVWVAFTAVYTILRILKDQITK